MKTRLFTVLFLLSLIANSSGSRAAAYSPITIAKTGRLTDTRMAVTKLPSLTDFIISIRNGDPQTLVGVYVNGIMALPVVQQPFTQPSFVSSENNVLTQFRMAGQYGTTGILAHNYLAGQYFFSVMKGHEVVLVYGDGSTKVFRIEEIQSYKALSPYSVYSNFVDLAAPGREMTSTEVFNRVYGQGDVLVLQTCIQVGNESSWGRIFLIGREKQADPVVSSVAQRSMMMAAMYTSAPAYP